MLVLLPKDTYEMHATYLFALDNDAHLQGQTDGGDPIMSKHGITPKRTVLDLKKA